MIGKIPTHFLVATLAAVGFFSLSNGSDGATGIRLPLDDAASYDFNGTHRVNISGNTVLVGGYYRNGSGTPQHWAQAFIYSGGEWQHQQTLSPGEPTSLFGYGVGIDGNTAVVGDHGNNKAYIFERSGSTWQVSSDPSLQYAGATSFGYDTRIDANRAIVGTYMGDSAYVFTGDGGWDEGKSHLAGSGYFGHSVDISGDHAIIGDYWNNTASIYRLDGDTWSLEFTLSRSGSDQFGYSVAIEGDYAIVGDNTTIVGGQSYVGSASIYQRQGDGTWTEQIYLSPFELVAGDRFGSSVAISDDTAVVGAINQGPFGQRAGSVYEYQRIDDVWKQVDRLRPTDGATGDEFGHAVAIDGDWIVVGAKIDDSPDGAAYIFNTTSLDLIPGDADLNGRVDETDATILASHWGLAAGWTGGDFDGDGLVGPTDASIMAAHWNYEMAAPSSSVPEPGAAALLAGLLLLSFNARTQRREGLLSY